MTIRVFIFEDDSGVRESLRDICTIMGYKTYVFSDPTETELKFRSSAHYEDLVITDVRMPFMSGIKLSEILINSGFNSKNIAIMSGFWIDKNIEYARNFGIRTFTKPLSTLEIAMWLQEHEFDMGKKSIIWDLS